MAGTLVDSNVLLDVLTEDRSWFSWSSDALASCADDGPLVINPLIYAEVSIGFERIEDIDDVLDPAVLQRRPLPWEAAFLAGKCFLRYRRRGGAKTSTLPDFYIGAHALVEGLRLVTRDATRYRTHFPGLSLVAPG